MPTARLYLGDCLHTLRKLPDNSVDSIVTDPPYGLSKQPNMAEVLRHWLAGDDYVHSNFGFMGKSWDSFVPGPSVWRECLRVLKPGGHLLAFAGTRTMDLMGLSLRLAGFELRDSIGYAHDDESNGAPLLAWCFGSGFPKNLDVSKQIDQQEKDRWVKISKAIDNLNFAELTELWANSKSVNVAGVKFQRKTTEVGRNTQKNGFAHENVLLQANRKNCDALAVIAELSLIEVHHTSVGTCSSAQSNVESSITESKSHATTAGKSPENREATPCMVDFSALQSAWGWQGESKADKLKAAEALKTWLGSGPSSRQGVTNALCAALTDDLKLITLSQSKTFLSFDTTRQTACASAINVTITESTAESLISFTVDTLKSKAIDKAAGAEREVSGVAVYADGHAQNNSGKAKSGYSGRLTAEGAGVRMKTAPATDAAKRWAGWGTALKPSFEPVLIARKPLAGTVAENVQQFGTGAINVDGCRVGWPDGKAPEIGTPEWGGPAKKLNAVTGQSGETVERSQPSQLGRWPANLAHDGSEAVTAGLGHAARFFYCSKASKRDRDEGLHGFTVTAQLFRSSDAEVGDETWVPEGQLVALRVDMGTLPPRVTAGFGVPHNVATEWSTILCGKSLTDLYRTDTMSTTKTATSSTMISRILNCFQNLLINGSMVGVLSQMGFGLNRVESAEVFNQSLLITSAKTALAHGVGGVAFRTQLKISVSELRNHHETVKPTELMRWLVRLVTPPGGTVADPFTGSGSTGKAAILEGFNFIGCELGADYMRIAVARIGHVMKGEKPVVFGLRPEVRDSAEVAI